MRKVDHFTWMQKALSMGWLFILAAAGCGGASTSTPQAPAVRDAKTALAAGQSALKGGNLAVAEASFREAIAGDPKSADAQLGLGNALMPQGKLAEAEAAYRAALASKPDWLPAQTNLGVALYQLGRQSEAADVFMRALKSQPDDATTIYMLAAVRIQQDNLIEAERLLRQARDLAPKLPEVYYGLGVLYRKKGQKADAIAAFEKFLEIGPGQDPTAMDFARSELKTLKGGQ